LLTAFHRTKLERPALDANTLHEVFVKYGGEYGVSARQGFLLAHIEEERISWERMLPGLLTDFSDIEIFKNNVWGNAFNHTTDAVLKASSQIITIHPIGDSRTPQVVPVSRHITLHLYKTVLESRYRKFWDLFNHFWSVSLAHSPAGWLWEAHVVNRALRGGGTLALQPLDGSRDELSMDLPFSQVIIFGNCQDLSKEMANAIPGMTAGSAILFIPAAMNQVTFTFSVSAQGKVKSYQSTIAPEHDAKAQRLDFIWDALVMAGLRYLLPTKRRKWQIVFVVPRRVSHHWTKSQSIDFGTLAPHCMWGDYLKQSVMILDDDGKGEEVEPMAADHWHKRTQVISGIEEEQSNPPSKRAKATKKEKLKATYIFQDDM
jgi:hypothetical protein